MFVGERRFQRAAEVARFLQKPSGAPGFFELLRQKVGDLLQMANVVQRVVELTARERTPRPVGARLVFRERNAYRRLNQRLIIQRIIEPDERGRELNVEKARRKPPERAITKFEFAPARVSDGDRAVLAKAFPKRAQVRNFQRVEERVAKFGRDLNEAKFRLITAFGDELGVVGDPSRAFDFFEVTFEARLRRDELIGRHNVAKFLNLRRTAKRFEGADVERNSTKRRGCERSQGKR